MTLTNIDIISRNKDDRKSLFLFFPYCNWREVAVKECYFTFAIKFVVIFIVRFWMDTFKMTEYNRICKVFTDVFLIVRIPHSTVIINLGQREKAILWPS